MSAVIETTVYQFDELTDAAKERAREWYREVAFDHDWFDGVYEDASECARLMGIEIDTKWAQTMSGKKIGSPAIYFSGFSSQGDGACFEGSYSYAKGGVAAIKEHAPNDAELHRIATILQQIQRRHFYQLTATVRQSGHYMHDQCTAIDVRRDTGSGDDYFFDTDDSIVSRSTHDGAELVQVLRSFMQWIYRQLESEWEYQNADEQVDESIRANEYTFTESGRRFG